jgi:hypothetical protein
MRGSEVCDKDWNTEARSVFNRENSLLTSCTRPRVAVAHSGEMEEHVSRMFHICLISQCLWVYIPDEVNF